MLLEIIEYLGFYVILEANYGIPELEKYVIQVLN